MRLRSGGAPWLLLLLAACLIGEVGFRQWQRRPLSLTGPHLDAPLVVPDNLVDVLGKGREQLADVLRSPGRCSLLVVASTHCSICRHMRYTWPSRISSWMDSVRTPVHLTWLSAATDTSELRAFFDGVATGDMTIARIPLEYPIRQLGVYGTPTVYLLDANGRLRIGIFADQLPPASAAQKVCLDA